MTNIEACIFDLDGVIVDTAVYHFKAWKNLADELGIDFTEEHNERLKGVSRMRSLEIILEIGSLDLPAVEKEKLAFRKNTEYLELVNQMTAAEILPGVTTFLADLKVRGIKIALGSASKNARTILEKINLLNQFEAIVDGTLVQKAKPDPEVFLLAARLLGVAPEHCVVFEDALAGVAAAKNAGMYCVGVGKPEILSQADQVISSFEGFSLEHIKTDIPA
ncbi:MAG: beta-phosphoglucomutase [Adhaeribacter sp.]|jgi:beta-phosphoglucomutase|nr:beta-phosphoglucomutase [Adhaeribacter sp.]